MRDWRARNAPSDTRLASVVAFPRIVHRSLSSFFGYFYSIQVFPSLIFKKRCRDSLPETSHTSQTFRIIFSEWKGDPAGKARGSSRIYVAQDLRSRFPSSVSFSIWSNPPDQSSKCQSEPAYTPKHPCRNAWIGVLFEQGVILLCMIRPSSRSRTTRHFSMYSGSSCTIRSPAAAG